MKLIVADDEKWVRSTIISLIPFENLGMTLVSEASNGIEALELCKQHKPDILITDIRMPGLTGLELIQELKLTLPKIKIIIISGYNDFSYAKTAMKLGVTDYILKPVDETELQQVLEKMKDTIIAENKLTEEHAFIKTQYKLALPVVHENFLASLIKPNLMTSEVINHTLKNYGINFPYPEFTIAVFSPDYPESIENLDDLKNYKNLVRKIMKRYCVAVTFSKSPDDTEIISIINNSPKVGTESLLKALSLSERFFRKKLATTLSIGISLSLNQATRLPDLYSQACEALNERFWNSPNGIFKYSPHKASENAGQKISDNTLDDVVLNLKLNDIQPLNFYIDNMCRKLSVEKEVNPSRVREFAWTFIQSVISRLNIQMSFIDYDTSIKGIHPYDRIRNTNFLEQLNFCMKEMIILIRDFYHQSNNVNGLNVINTAKKIIEENYSKDISLEQISRLVHLNPTYFSELFKKELGMSFIDYKTCVRMENAKKLLTSTDMNVYEISSKIGYTDSKYFSKLFKKLTGVTPFEFKEGSKTPPVNS